MKEIVFLVEESLDGGYDAQALGNPIFTQAETLAELREMVRDAVQCHFNPNETPAIIRLHFYKEEVLTI